MVSVSVVMAIGIGFLPCGLTPMVSASSLIVGLMAGIAVFSFTEPRPSAKLEAWDWVMLAIFSLASLRAFLWLVYQTGNEWKVLSPYNLGDISLHIQFIQYMASGIRFWPESPILSGSPLVYPPGIDLWNSLLLQAGIPLRQGLIWVGLCGAALTAWSLWRWGGAFAIACLLFNGGLAGFEIFQTHQIQDFQSALAWKNLFLTMFVTQRGLLFAIPCGLTLLNAWRDDFFGDGSGIPRWVQWILYAFLPLFSAHAFLFLSLVLLGIFIFEGRSRPALLLFVSAAIIPATLSAYLVTGGFSSNSGLRWLLGWMQGKAGWTFWLINFGVTLPLLGVVFWKGIVRGNSLTLSFLAPSLGIFTLCLFVAFAPWEWDNTKLMLWGWITAAPFLWQLAIQPLAIPFRIPLCAILFFSGAVSLVGGLDSRHGYTLLQRQEVDRAKAALSIVPHGERIAIDPEFNNPVILLGYPVVCGYEGHLWSHGLHYRETWAKLKNVLQQGPEWKRDAREINADWIFLKGLPPTLIRIPKD